MIRRRAATTALAAFACLLGVAPPAPADEERGMRLTREAQAALAAGDAERAVELLGQARTEWPGSAVVAHTLADAHAALGRYDEAIDEYERGMRAPYEHRSRFNRGVARHTQAEAGLGQAGVPLDPAGLPEGPQPEMLAAIQQALPTLNRSIEEFLTALDLEPGGAARQSIGAINRRIDALEQMRDELQDREEPSEDEGEGDEQQPSDDPGEEGEPNEDSSEQPGEEPPPEDQQAPSQDESEPEQQPGEEDPDADEQANPQDVPVPEPSEPRLLSTEEVQRLLDQLEQLEAEARQLQKLREAAQRRAVDKDW